jgi:hypothetical protein
LTVVKSQFSSVALCPGPRCGDISVLPFTLVCRAHQLGIHFGVSTVKTGFGVQRPILAGVCLNEN